MSDLAFNVHGEWFEVPAAAESWRVRRFKASGRGTPEVVFGPDGLPLVVPIDADIAEFRQLVGGVSGRYRLDPIDGQQRACEAASGAYIQLSETSLDAREAANPAVLLETVIRANTEMVKAITEKFAAVMESAAVLLRAADGAGLPAREPLALRNVTLPAPAAASKPELREPEAEENAYLGPILQTALTQFMPILSHTIHTKVLGLTAEQSVAMMTGAAVRATGQSAAESAAPTSTITSAAEPATEVSAAAPMTAAPPPDFGSHLAAIQKLLTPEETSFAHRAIQNMAPDVLARWRSELLELTPKAAASVVRAAINQGSTS